MKVTYDGEGKLFLHKEIGKGTMPDGRKCRLIMTDNAIHMKVYSKSNKNGKWKTFTVTWMELSKAIVDEIIKIEKG